MVSFAMVFYGTLLAPNPPIRPSPARVPGGGDANGFAQGGVTLARGPGVRCNKLTRSHYKLFTCSQQVQF